MRGHVKATIRPAAEAGREPFCCSFVAVSGSSSLLRIRAAVRTS
jgi:hypothetical protein